MVLTKGHHVTAHSFKQGGIGDGPNKYSNRHCLVCGEWKRALWKGMCNRCHQRERYKVDMKYRKKELKRTREYRRNLKKKAERQTARD